MPPLILITNDDGVLSPGLAAAVAAVRDLGEVLVVAPSQQQSASGRAFFGDKEAQLRAVDLVVGGAAVRAYACDCSPALAVQHGVAVLCRERRPDLAISGINYGENLGFNVTLSGTVGAALQAAERRIPALAVSLQTDHRYHFQYGAVDWPAAAHFTRLFAERMLRQALPADVHVLNVVVPEHATARTPSRITRLARQSYFDTVLETPSATSRIGDGHFGVHIDADRLEPDSDIYALVHDGVVSVTPLSLDLTSRVDRAALGTLLLDGGGGPIRS